MSNYHPDAKVNRNCQRIIDALYKHPATLAELSKSLLMFGYDVEVALSTLSAQNRVIRTTKRTWEFISF